MIERSDGDLQKKGGVHVGPIANSGDVCVRRDDSRRDVPNVNIKPALPAARLFTVSGWLRQPCNTRDWTGCMKGGYFVRIRGI